MGLDWLPGPKPRPGCEHEFVRLWTELESKDVADRDRKVTRFGAITTTAFETLKAPRVGFDADAVRSKGLGLISMSERLEAMGGTLKVCSRAGAGTRLEVAVPIPSAEGTGAVAV